MAAYYADTAVGSDSNAGTSPGAGNAWATIAHALATATGASDVIWVKASGTYAITGTLTFPGSRNDLPNAAPYYLMGYTTTPGDNGQATIATSSAIDLITLAGNNVYLGNFILDCGTTATRGVKVTAGNPERGMRLQNLIVKNGFTTWGIDNTGSSTGQGPTVNRVLVMGGASGASGAYGGSGFIANSALVNNQCHGLNFNAGNMGVLTMSRVVVANNNSGGTYHGLLLNDSLSGSLIRNVVSYNNSGDGVRFNGTYEAVSVIDSILALNGGYGINGGFSTTVANMLQNLNAYYSNASGPVHNIIAGANDITLSGNPFVNPSGSIATLADVWANFALNGTAGAGAACKGAGYP